MRNTLGALGALLVAVTLATPVEAATVTVATFADPSGTSTNPLFTFTDTGTSSQGSPAGSTLDGGWFGTGLTLIFMPASAFTQSFSDVTFDFPTLTATGGFASGGGSLLSLGAGSFSFIYNGLAILTYSWTGATLTDNSVGAADLNLQGVTLTGSNALAGWTFSAPQSFAFSYTNATNTIFGALAGGTATWTSAFTSSASATQNQPPVPEPGSLLLLGVGLVGLAVTIRRRRASRIP